jgi:hypothetical protein
MPSISSSALMPSLDRPHSVLDSACAARRGTARETREAASG